MNATMLNKNSEKLIDDGSVSNRLMKPIEEIIDKTELTLKYYDKWTKVCISCN